MEIRSIIFDFDGTLIDSNHLKYDAYFELFPKNERQSRIIRHVLSERFEQTRFVILKEILRRLSGKDVLCMKEDVRILAERYNDIVLAGAKMCPEKRGAEEALKKLAPKYRLYVSSTTLEVSLKEIIQFRKWDKYFCGMFGYPHKKPETLQYIMEREKLRNNEMLVVGDGESDRESAEKNGCPFLPVAEDFSFSQIEQMINSLIKEDIFLQTKKEIS